MKKRHTVRNIIIALCIAAAAGGVIWYFYQNNMKQPVDVYSMMLLNSPYWDDGQSYQANVTDGAMQDIKLRDGLVESIRVKEGDKVRKGDVVMTYDKTSLNLAMSKAEASAALLENQIQKARRQIEEYKGLQPSENEPEGWEETIDLGPLVTKDRLIPDDLLTEDLALNCTIDSVLSKDFLISLSELEEIAFIDLYDGNMTYGTLTVDGSLIPAKLVEYVPYDLPIPTVTPDPGPTEEPTVTPDPGPTGDPTVTPDPGPTGDPTITPDPGPTGDPTITPDPGPTGDPTVTPDPDTTGEPTVTPDPGPSGEPVPTEDPGPSAEPDPTGEPVPEPDTIGKKKTTDSTIDPEPTPQLYIKIEEDLITEDWKISDIVSYNGTEGELNPDSDYALYCDFEPCEPTEYERYDIEYHEPDYDWDDESENYMYSRKELAEMIKEQEDEIADLTLDLKEAQLDLEECRIAAKTGEVVAAIDGTVVELRDPEECATDDTLMKIKGEDDFIITVYVSEMDLRSVSPGDLYSITAYESGNMFETVVKEIGDTPANGSYAYGNVNPNNSYYPVYTVAKEKDLDLSVGEMCEASADSGEEEETDAIYIPIMFTRSDSRGTYVMKDENGMLKKQYVRTGKILWGYEIEIRSGVQLTDSLAFPYGKTVSEGCPTNQADELNFY